MLHDYIATFEKVSFEQFKKDLENEYGLVDNICQTSSGEKDEILKSYYDNIKIPSRATHESAGYDFYLPFPIKLTIRDSIVIPTGIRCKISKGYSLDIYPKSGLGFKYNLKIANTVGIIDSDYYNSSNEGHVKIKIDYEGFKFDNGSLELPVGKSFAQGIFHEVFAATNDFDNTEMVTRDGGFGSTN